MTLYEILEELTNNYYTDINNDLRYITIEPIQQYGEVIEPEYLQRERVQQYEFDFLNNIDRDDESLINELIIKDFKIYY